MSTESEESPGLVEFLTWLETHKQKLVGGGVVALVLGSAAYIVNWSSKQKEQAAGSALYEVQLKEGEEDEANQPGAQEYVAIADEYAGTSAAERSLLLAARSDFLAGDYDAAREKFERFQAEFDSSEFVSSALYGVAACYDAAGQSAEAKGAFQAVLNRFANTAIAAQAKLAMASLHESDGELSEALALYDDVNRPGVPSVYSSRAAARREKLYDRNPELRPEPETMDMSDAEGVAPPVEGVSTDTMVVPNPTAEAASAEAVSTESAESESGESEESPETPDTGDVPEEATDDQSGASAVE